MWPTDFFSNFYRRDEEHNVCYPLEGVFSRLSTQPLMEMHVDASDGEIKEFIFSMGSYKALGSDGTPRYIFSISVEHC